MESSRSIDPEKISIGTVKGIDANPFIEVPRKGPNDESTSPEELMKRVQEVAESGQHMKGDLDDLLKQTGSDSSEDFATRHRRRGELLEKFRQDLLSQREGMGITLNQLSDEIHRNPGASATELFEVAAQNSQTYHFDIQQLNAIAEGLLEYERKHQAVENAVAQYPDPNELFTANFGFPPTGRVEIVKGPMTINFRCYDPEDYQVAYAGGRDLLTEENIALSSNSAGFATPGSRLSGLRGTVIVENISADQSTWVNVPKIRKYDTHENPSFRTTHVKEVSIQLSDGSLAHLSIEGLPPIADRPFEYYERIMVTAGNNHAPILDVVEVTAHENMRFYWKYRDFSNHNDPTNQKNDIRLAIGDSLVTIEDGSISISSTTPAKMEVTYADKELVYDPDQAHPKPNNSIIRHEEQHQFNRLFTTYENRVIGRQVLSEVLASHSSNSDSNSADEGVYGSVVKDVAVRLARNARGDMIDRRARDEILAYYRDGRSIGEILQLLSKTKEGVKNSPYGEGDVALYDFASFHAYEIKQVPQEILGIIEIYNKEIIDTLKLDPSKITPPTAEQLIPIVNQVFGSEYQEELKRWTTSISFLEGKGYPRKDILALLYQYPASRWSNVVRQMPNRFGEAD